MKKLLGVTVYEISYFKKGKFYCFLVFEEIKSTWNQTENQKILTYKQSI